MSFDQLGLDSKLQSAIKKGGFESPTPIQIKCIPEILKGEDLIIEAQTGTGKTASFVLPILQKLCDLKAHKRTKVLVLSPTRELALQTTASFFRFSRYLENDFSIVSIIGGESIDKQNKTLTFGVEIIVATPGRLLDLIDQMTVTLKDLEFLILDEADKILDLGFALELDNVLSHLPNKRQTLFFSATYPEKVLELVKKISPNPRLIKFEDETPTVQNIFQRAILVNQENRGALIRHLLRTENWNHVLVFVASKTKAQNLSEKLKKININSGHLHGDLSQSDRNDILKKFKSKEVQVLIATDIAARGIDIENLEVVINFDLPRSPADYIHRIGRTGRNQAQGLAISFIGHEDQDHFKLIEKRAEIKLEREEIKGFELTGDAPIKIKGKAPIKGKRKSKKDKLREQKIIISDG